MGHPPAHFDDAMERMRAPLVAAGMVVDDMRAFAEVQRSGRLHIAEEETAT